MKSLTPTRIIAFLCISGLAVTIQAQNLVPNPSFEEYTECPTLFGGGGPLEAVPWQSANEGTTDYFHQCASPNYCGVPDNYFGWQEAHTGVAYGGGFLWGSSQPNYREYLQVRLNSPLIAGYMYYVSMYVSLADQTYCGLIPYGAYFSVNPPPIVPDYYLIELNPQFENSGGYLSDYDNWMHLEGCILAQGGEEWVTFGSFHDYLQTPPDPTCPFLPGVVSYYYLDDVLVAPTIPDEEFDADIGGPFTGCVEVTVEPDIPGQFYWSDGSIGPTFTVNESGIYSYSVVDSCRLGTGTFEVIIFDDAVEAVSDEVQICEGDTYTITMFGDYAEYIWSTGSTESSIDVTDAGIYSVTIDFGCFVSEIDIEVVVANPVPDPIFGEDTHLCPVEVISYSFDDIVGTFLWQNGSTENEYVIEEGGTYQLTISNACGVVDDEIIIVDFYEPEINLGPDTFLCENGTIEISLDPSQGEYIWQDGSDDLEYTISSPGSYSVFVYNICGQQSDNLLVTAVPALQTDLGQDLTLCPAQLPLTLDASSPGTPTYIWNDTTMIPQLLVTDAGTFSVTVSNECFTIIDTINIAVTNEPPDVILPADIALCSLDTIVITNTGATGTYIWQDQSSADSFLITTPGTYSLSVTNICGTGSDSIIVDYSPPIQVPDLGPDFSLCTGDMFTLTTGITNVSYQWQDMSNADSFTISGPGVYYVTVSNQCGSATDSVVVTLNNNPPDVDLPAQLNLCQGEVITLEAGISGVAYAWNDGSQTASIDIYSPGTYSLTVSSNCGSDFDSVIVNDAGPPPAVELGNDIHLCEGETIIITPVFSNVDNWIWYDGSGTPAIEVSVGGQVSIQAMNVCGTDSDTLEVNQLPAVPALSLGNDTSFCTGHPVMLSINIQDVDITWSDGTHGNSIIADEPGSYHAMIENPCGLAFDTIVIEKLPEAPVVNLGTDQKLCPGEMVLFSPDVSDVDFLWHDGSTGSTFTATSPGTIILSVSNECGIDSDTVLIVLNTEGPQVDLGPDIQGCTGDEVTIEAGISGVDYLWQDGSNTSSFTTMTSSALILTISNNCGVDADTIEIDLSGVAPDVQLGVDTIICAGNTLLLQYLPSPGTTLVWQDGSSSSEFEVASAGIYTLTATNACGNDIDSIQVDSALAPASFSLGPDTILCAGESIELIAPVTGDDILWGDGSTFTTVVAEEARIYTLQLSNECGNFTDSIQVSINDNIPVVQLDDEIIVCQHEKLLLDVEQAFPSNYLWSTGENTPAITIITSGTYAVTVFNDCFTTQDEIIVIEDDCTPHIYIPNVFSPNGDGINDIFEISFSETITILEIQGTLYDRWGGIMFSSTNLPFTWNGYVEDQPLNPSVLTYRIRVRYLFRGMEREEVLVGDVTVMR